MILMNLDWDNLKTCLEVTNFIIQPNSHSTCHCFPGITPINTQIVRKIASGVRMERCYTSASVALSNVHVTQIQLRSSPERNQYPPWNCRLLNDQTDSLRWDSCAPGVSAAFRDQLPAYHTTGVRNWLILIVFI